MRNKNQKTSLPLHKRIVFWLVLPVIVVGVGISALLIRHLGAPMEAYLAAHFEESLRLASTLGIGVCDKHFKKLLDMRLEDNREMNHSLKNVALQEIRTIAERVPNVEMLVLEKKRLVKSAGGSFLEELGQPLPPAPGPKAIQEFSLAGEAVKAHIRYFPFWDWHIVSYMKTADFMAPIQTAHRIIYLSTLGVLVAVFATLLFVFNRFVTAPLNRLITATKEISDGRLPRLRQIRDNEIGQLMAFFNQMVESLQRKEDQVSHLIGRLQESEQRYRSLVELFPEAVFIHQDGKIKYFNRSGALMFGAADPVDLVGRPADSLIHPDQEETAPSGFAPAAQESAPLPPKPLACRGLDNRIIEVEATATCIDYGGRPATLNVLRDISERKRAEAEKARLEEQFQQAQKLESIGRLAGGVAHDLNNLLSPILGYSELLLDSTGRDDPRREGLEEIMNAGSRARSLIRQLLAFSRKQTLEFKLIYINSLLEEFEKLLRRTIREDISLRRIPGENLPPVKGDAGQIEQVVLNLAVNAQDAMPNGGELTIETDRVEVGESDAAGVEDPAPGLYVRMTLSDTGEGLDADAREHLFEPFFTTKEKGRGTGLGLATVYGIIKQHGGHIRVGSRPGAGTVFHIYLPAVSDTLESAARAPDSKPARTGSETILIVEDDRQVMGLGTAILERLGYSVLPAASAEEALTLLKQQTRPVDLLLTDVIMPGMNGKQLFDKISASYPGMRVLFMSGYTDNVIAHHGVIEPGVHFIQKPFSVQSLAAKVREVLDQTPPSLVSGKPS